MHRASNVEVSCWGAAGLAGLGAGLWESREILERLRQSDEKGQIFLPQKKTGTEDYRKWVEACKRFSKWQKI